MMNTNMKAYVDTPAEMLNSTLEFLKWELELNRSGLHARLQRDRLKAEGKRDMLESIIRRLSAVEIRSKADRKIENLQSALAATTSRLATYRDKLKREGGALVGLELDTVIEAAEKELENTKNE